MSRLYFSEQGNVVPTLCEELTQHRRARKVLELPSTGDFGTLFILARQHKDCDLPLRLSVNNTELPSIEGASLDGYCWYAVRVDASCLKPCGNVFEFWTDSPSMTAWSLAIEAGHPKAASYISDDGGLTWRNKKMAYLNVLSGEYIVRIRLNEGEDPPPPPMVWEEPNNPRLERLRAIAPPKARTSGQLLDRVRGLTSWLSTSFEHTSSGRAAQYAPWDAETILAWGRAKSGHAGQRPIVMCVHYSAAFVSFCQAFGIHARGAALARTPNGYDGHFVTEVWFPEFNKWVMVDANLDAIMWKNGIPLSIPEIRALGPDLGSFIEWGAGSDFQLRNPAIKDFIENSYSRGLCFKHRSIWPRADFLSHPELTPAGHGSTCYCETELIWEQQDLQAGFAMFPYFGSRDYFEAPPTVG